MWLVMIVSGIVADALRQKHILRTTSVRKLCNAIGKSLPGQLSTRRSHHHHYHHEKIYSATITDKWSKWFWRYRPHRAALRTSLRSFAVTESDLSRSIMPYCKCVLTLAKKKFFLYAAYSPGKDFELILMVKIETRGTICPWVFGICNHCGVMTAWSHKIGYFFSNFCILCKNDPVWCLFSYI